MMRAWRASWPSLMLVVCLLAACSSPDPALYTIVPVKADSDVADADLTGRHVVLIGRPVTNAVARRFADAFPVKFGTGSAQVADEVFAHDGTAVVAVGVNPLAPRYSVVVVAGLSADATYRIADRASFPTASSPCTGDAPEPSKIFASLTKRSNIRSSRALLSVTYHHDRCK